MTRIHAPHMPQRLAGPERLIVPRDVLAPVRISADQPGAAMEEVRGPTRTKVRVPVTDEKLVPGDVLVNVPGPIKGSRFTRVKVA